ncbi:MAG: hypothetical protein GF308_03560 [Candidatus Heimdallarchaeota archaeon]|nr:hypothetical protein [Candidatus Heimdallarchaeota archaeon]
MKKINNNITKGKDQKDQLILEKLEEIIGNEIVKENDYPTSRTLYYSMSETRVISLSLQSQYLEQLPPIIDKFEGLISLRVAHNKLPRLPDFLLRLSKLIILDVSHNQVTKIPSWIDRLEHLRELRLNNNQILSVPSALANLSLLRKLYLQNNPIHSLPMELAHLELLEELHIDFRVSMKKSSRGILTRLESKGCEVRNEYNRR